MEATSTLATTIDIELWCTIPVPSPPRREQLREYSPSTSSTFFPHPGVLIGIFLVEGKSYMPGAWWWCLANAALRHVSLAALGKYLLIIFRSHDLCFQLSCQRPSSMRKPPEAPSKHAQPHLPSSPAARDHAQWSSRRPPS